MGIVILIFFGLYKGLQILGRLTVGGSFGVGLGRESSSQEMEERRSIKTDAPVQVIYRLDENRFLTLENYISCDKGGQVYYNDNQRGIKTFLGFETDVYNERFENDIAAYEGLIINGADNGYLAFPGAVTAQYCGSGNFSTGCPVFFFVSIDYGKSFTYQIVDKGYNTPSRFSRMKVMVANDGVYIDYGNEGNNNKFKEINKFWMDDGKLVDFLKFREKKSLGAFKKRLLEKELPYAEGYNFTDQYIYDYVDNIKPSITSNQKNKIIDEYFSIKKEAVLGVNKYRLSLPFLLNRSADSKYQCNEIIRAGRVSYINKNDGKEVIKNDQ